MDASRVECGRGLVCVGTTEQHALSLARSLAFAHPTTQPSPGDQKRHLDHLAIQSGGFTTEFFDRLSAGGALGGALDALTDGRGTAVDVRAAMAQAEDENDAAAAAALEQETAAELQEFAAEGAAAAGGEGEEDDDEEEGGTGEAAAATPR